MISDQNLSADLPPCIHFHGHRQKQLNGLSPEHHKIYRNPLVCTPSNTEKRPFPHLSNVPFCCVSLILHTWHLFPLEYYKNHLQSYQNADLLYDQYLKSMDKFVVLRLFSGPYYEQMTYFL